MTNKVMYFGREIKATMPKECPGIVLIDVLQKEEDCPRGYDLDERMKCLCDCQNTYASFPYNLFKNRIQVIGTLIRGGISFDLNNLKKHDLTPEEIREIMRGEDESVKIEKFPAKMNIYYKGDLLAFIPKCEFFYGEKMFTNDPEVNQYIDLITQNPRRIITECGIEFKRIGGIEIVICGEENQGNLNPPIIPDGI